MKKNVILYGLFSGLFVSAVMIISTAMYYNDPTYKGSMVLGFAAIILSFSLIFVGVKNYRDKYNNGIITFGKAFLIGLYIVLISSTLYVIVWLIDYFVFIPDFMERYADLVISEAKNSGASAEELAKTTQDMAIERVKYKNPLYVILYTYLEILPVGVLMNLISALVFMRKTKKETVTAS